MKRFCENPSKIFAWQSLSKRLDLRYFQNRFSPRRCISEELDSCLTSTRSLRVQYLYTERSSDLKVKKEVGRVPSEAYGLKVKRLGKVLPKFSLTVLV